MILSSPLCESLQARLEAGEQAIVLLNRRGFATSVVCRQCASTLECPLRGRRSLPGTGLGRATTPGTGLIIDNDGSRSTFGSWFRRGFPDVDPEAVERFWSVRGWTRGYRGSLSRSACR